MNQQEIFNFVTQQLSKGAGRAEIEKILHLNQVPPQEIEQAFQLAEQTLSTIPTSPDSVTIPPSSIPTTPIQKSAANFVISLVIILLILILGAGGVYVYLKQSDWLKHIPIINELIQTAPSPEEAMESMMANLSRVKTFEHQLELKLDLTLTEYQGTPREMTLLGRVDNANLTLNVTGKNDLSNQNKPKLDFKTDLNTKVSGAEQQMAFDFSISALREGEITYLKLNKIPSLMPIPGIDQLTDRWIKFDLDALKSSTSSPFSMSLPNTATEVLGAEKINQLQKDIMATKPIQLSKFIGKREVNNKPAYGYELIVSKEDLKRVVNIIYNVAPQPDNIITEDKLKKAIDQLNFPAMEIWLSQENLLPYQITLPETVIIIPSIDSNSGDTPLTISAQANFSNYNQPVNIQIPTEYKTIEEAVGEIFGLMMKENLTEASSTDSMMSSDYYSEDSERQLTE